MLVFFQANILNCCECFHISCQSSGLLFYLAFGYLKVHRIIPQLNFEYLYYCPTFSVQNTNFVWDKRKIKLKTSSCNFFLFCSIILQKWSLLKCYHQESRCKIALNFKTKINLIVTKLSVLSDLEACANLVD